MDDYKKHWKHLTHEEEIQTLIADSHLKPVLIFKHSTRCGISMSVRRNFMERYSYPEDAPTLYYLDLLKFRSVSNAVAKTLDVHHQSPQAILVQDGAVKWHASHYEITIKAFENALAS